MAYISHHLYKGKPSIVPCAAAEGQVVFLPHTVYRVFLFCLTGAAKLYHNFGAKKTPRPVGSLVAGLDTPQLYII